MRAHKSISDLVLVMTCAAVLSGCGTTQPVGRAFRSPSLGNQGETWESVLGSPDAPPLVDWEYARLDESMNIRTSFDEPASLDDLRRLYLNPRADQVLYYRRAWR